MLKTFSLKHGLDVAKFLYAYLSVLNSIIHDIWASIEWKEKYIEGKDQKRILPYYQKNDQWRKI